MNSESKDGFILPLVVIALVVSFAALMNSYAEESPQETVVIYSNIMATTTTTMDYQVVVPPCDNSYDDYCSPATPRARLIAKSPLHVCSATMADIRPGVVFEVYSLEYGFRYRGEITSWPYPIEVGDDGDFRYVVDIDVEGQSWRHQGSLGDMGLLPYIPGGRWNPVNFTVVEGTCKGVALPTGR